jgi:hypothetical protein
METAVPGASKTRGDQVFTLSVAARRLAHHDGKPARLDLEMDHKCSTGSICHFYSCAL